METQPTGGGRHGALLEFLAPGLAHELGNSLFSIRGAAYLLEGERADSQKVQRLLGEGYDKATRALDLLRELTADAVGGKPCVLGAAIRRVLDVARVPLRDRRHRAVLALDPAPDRIVVDSSAATPALLNCLVALSDIARGAPAEIHIARDGAANGVASLVVRVEAENPDQPIVFDHASVAALIQRTVERNHGAQLAASGDALRLGLRYSF